MKIFYKTILFACLTVFCATNIGYTNNSNGDEIPPPNYIRISKDYTLTAYEYALSGDHKKAIRIYNIALKYDKTNSSAYILRGKSKFEIQDYTGASKDFSQALSLDSKLVMPYILREISIGVIYAIVAFILFKVMEKLSIKKALIDLY